MPGQVYGSGGKYGAKRKTGELGGKHNRTTGKIITVNFMFS